MRRGTMHRVVYVGRLGSNPDVKTIKDGKNAGKRVVKLNVSETIPRRKKSGEDFELDTIWHRITAFGRQADYAAEYLKKADGVYIEARNRPASWKDAKGVEQTTLDVIADVVMRTSPGRFDENPSSGDEEAKTRMKTARELLESDRAKMPSSSDTTEDYSAASDY